MTSGPAGPYSRNRLFEWTMTVSLIGLGLHLFLWPRSMGASSFRFILELISAQYLMLFYLAVGGFRAAALIANGRWQPWGAHIRALGSLLGAAVWLQMDVALIRLIPEVGTPPSPGIPVYSALVVAELFSTYRAARDATRYR